MGGLLRKGLRAQLPSPSDRPPNSAPARTRSSWPLLAILPLLCWDGADRPYQPRVPQTRREGRALGSQGAAAPPGPVFPRFSRGRGKIFLIQKLTAGLRGRPRALGEELARDLRLEHPTPFPLPSWGPRRQKIEVLFYLVKHSFVKESSVKTS